MKRDFTNSGTDCKEFEDYLGAAGEVAARDKCAAIVVEGIEDDAGSIGSEAAGVVGEPGVREKSAEEKLCAFAQNPPITRKPNLLAPRREPGRYRQLREQIDVHRWYLGERLGREVTYEEAVRSWCEQVYLPLAREIQESGVMKDFPNRTVADLFLWISHHREELREQYNLDLDEKAAVSTFASVYSDKPLSKAIKSARLAVARMAAGDDVIVGLPKEEETGKPEDQ